MFVKCKDLESLAESDGFVYVNPDAIAGFRRVGKNFELLLSGHTIVIDKASAVALDSHVPLSLTNIIDGDE